MLFLFVVLGSYVSPLLDIADSRGDTKAERERLDAVRAENRHLEARFENLTRSGGKGATDGVADRAAAAQTAAVGTTGTAAEVAPDPVATEPAGDPANAEEPASDPGNAGVEADAAPPADPAPEAGASPGAVDGGGDGGGSTTGAVAG